MADYKTKQFFGTTQTVYNSSSAISASNFSAAGTEFNNTSDSAVPYATHAVAVLSVPYGATAPTAGLTVELWGLMTDVDGTTDETNAPSGTDSNGARFIGAWVLDNASSSTQVREIVISLEGIRKFVPYIKNGAQVATNTNEATTVKITPFCFGTTV